jgi:Zn-finger protein
MPYVFYATQRAYSDVPCAFVFFSEEVNAWPRGQLYLIRDRSTLGDRTTACFVSSNAGRKVWFCRDSTSEFRTSDAVAMRSSFVESKGNSKGRTKQDLYYVLVDGLPATTIYNTRRVMGQQVSICYCQEVHNTLAQRKPR